MYASRTRIVATLAAMVVCGASASPAHADNLDIDTGKLFGVAMYMTGTLAMHIPALVSGSVATYCAARNTYRQPMWVSILGYTSGAINLLVGGIHVGLYYGNRSDSSKFYSNDFWKVTGFTGLSVGAFTLVTNLIAGRLPKKTKPPRWSIAPLVGQDSRGRPFIGAGLAVAQF